jgi:hypothetical protein
MTILTPDEKLFLDVFLHEGTTSPFIPLPKAMVYLAVNALCIAWGDAFGVP